MCVVGGRDVRGGWARPRRFIWTMRAQHAMEAGPHWRCRYPRRPVSGQSAPAASRRSAVSLAISMIRARSAFAQSVRWDRGDQHPAADHPAANHHRPSSVAACGRRCRPEHRSGRAVRLLRRPVRCRAPGSGGLPDGSCVLVRAEEDRREFPKKTTTWPASGPGSTRTNPERFRASPQVAQERAAYSRSLIIVRAGIGVGHAVPK